MEEEEEEEEGEEQGQKEQNPDPGPTAGAESMVIAENRWRVFFKCFFKKNMSYCWWWWW